MDLNQPIWVRFLWLSYIFGEKCVILNLLYTKISAYMKSWHLFLFFLLMSQMRRTTGRTEVRSNEACANDCSFFFIYLLLQSLLQPQRRLVSVSTEMDGRAFRCHVQLGNMFPYLPIEANKHLWLLQGHLTRWWMLIVPTEDKSQMLVGFIPMWKGFYFLSVKLSKASLNPDILLSWSDLPKLDPIRAGLVCVCVGGVFLISVTGSR